MRSRDSRLAEPCSPGGDALGSARQLKHRAKLLLVLCGILAASGPRLCFGSAAPDVVRATLPNGLRVIAVKSPFARVVATTISYLVGANETPEDFPGLAHAQEHMMFRGSPGLSAAQISRITASLGGSFNAVTKQTVTQFFFTVPAEDLDVVLHLEAIRMRSVLDTQELWEKERAAIQHEVAHHLSDAAYLASKKALALLFEGSVYAHDSLGTPASFEKITAEMLRAFHHDWYVPNNAVVVIVGDVEPARAVAEASRQFGDTPAKKLPPRPKVGLNAVKPASFDFDTDRPYGLASMSFRLPGSDSSDFAAAKVLADLLSSVSSDLHDLVPRGKALSTEFSLDSLPAASVGSARAAFPKGGDSAALARDLRSVFSGPHGRGVEALAVEAAKRRLILEAEIEKSSVGGLADAWSRAVGIEGRTSPGEELEDIRKVTPADVARVAHEHLDPDVAVIAVLTPQSSRERRRRQPVRARRRRPA
jgi:zinc protease